jgi:hypothetical protein
MKQRRRTTTCRTANSGSKIEPLKARARRAGATDHVRRCGIRGTGNAKRVGVRWLGRAHADPVLLYRNGMLRLAMRGICYVQPTGRCAVSQSCELPPTAARAVPVERHRYRHQEAAAVIFITNIGVYRRYCNPRAVPRVLTQTGRGSARRSLNQLRKTCRCSTR